MYGWCLTTAIVIVILVIVDMLCLQVYMSGGKQWINLGIDALEPLGSKLLRISRMWKGLMLHRAASRNSSSCFVNLFQLEGVISWVACLFYDHGSSKHMQISYQTSTVFEHQDNKIGMWGLGMVGLYKQRFPTTPLSQLFREPFTSFRRPLRVMFFSKWEIRRW